MIAWHDLGSNLESWLRLRFFSTWILGGQLKKKILSSTDRSWESPESIYLGKHFWNGRVRGLQNSIHPQSNKNTGKNCRKSTFSEPWKLSKGLQQFEEDTFKRNSRIPVRAANSSASACPTPTALPQLCTSLTATVVGDRQPPGCWRAGWAWSPHSTHREPHWLAWLTACLHPPSELTPETAPPPGHLLNRRQLPSLGEARGWPELKRKPGKEMSTGPLEELQCIPGDRATHTCRATCMPSTELRRPWTLTSGQPWGPVREEARAKAGMATPRAGGVPGAGAESLDKGCRTHWSERPQSQRQASVAPHDTSYRRQN